MSQNISTKVHLYNKKHAKQDIVDLEVILKVKQQFFIFSTSPGLPDCNMAHVPKTNKNMSVKLLTFD